YPAGRSQPSAAKYRSPGLLDSAAATQPSGERTDSPSPLSSQTNRIGSRRPACSHQPAVLNAAVALAGVVDAAPDEQTTTASPRHAPVGRPESGKDGSTPSRRARSMAKPMPTARGRWDAIVEVVGMISNSALPNTLCRPPAIGSLAEATSPRSTSRPG